MRQAALAHRTVCIVALLALAAAQPSAAAGNDTGTLGVSTSVIGRCQLTLSGVAFGNVKTVTTAPVTANGNVSVRCNGLITLIELSFDDGQHFAGGTRRMAQTTDPTRTLEYELYQQAGFNRRWGSSGNEDVIGIITPFGRDWRVYGRIPAGAGAQAGTGLHTDSVVVTIRW